MQLHNIKPDHKKHGKKRVGRGGKRGTFSGRGSKGQKSRAGARIRPGFRGGNEPLWKLFPKKRGATKKVEIRQRLFRVHAAKPAIINLSILERYFSEGDTVSPVTLKEKGLVKNKTMSVKILSDGELRKKLVFSDDIAFSKSAHDKIH